MQRPLALLDWRISLLVHQRCDRNLAKLDWTVVTLESDAARLAFIGVVRHCR